MIGYIVTAVLTTSVLGVWFRFRGDMFLGSVIEFQKRLRGGFYWKADLFERCPSCGHRDRKSFSYDLVAQRLIASCPICDASWPKRTRVPAQSWDYIGLTMKANQDQIENVREAFERANEPVIKKKKEEVAA